LNLHLLQASVGKGYACAVLLVWQLAQDDLCQICLRLGLYGFQERDRQK
jgi:hypothetical protein